MHNESSSQIGLISAATLPCKTKRSLSHYTTSGQSCTKNRQDFCLFARSIQVRN